ncbi:MAG TPA: DNA-protecting protein DprA [Propionibacteriaceae bacterium]|nr:DNA-protecting protein DprA [Propionibacteriaceae bacterium]
MTERLARLCLAAVAEPGHPALSEALTEFDAEEVWAGLLDSDAGSGIAARARRLDPEQLVARTRETGQRFVMPGDPEWPQFLSELDHCESVHQLAGVPIGLWVRGRAELAALTNTSVAIVGSRAASAYGEHVAADLSVELSEAGWTVISGGAYGIDAAAHRGALAGRTPTVAVLAGGLDQPYPGGHRSLFERIVEKGLLVSELPPGEHPTRVRFLARNRLIAALSKGTVLVEAAARSGARNTVSWASALHRPVMAVPGSITSATSVTPHRLIREAEAVLVTGGAEVLEMVAPIKPLARGRATATRRTDSLSPEELRVFEMVPGRGSVSVGDLAVRAALPLPACLAALNRLAEEDFLRQDRNGSWRLPPREPQ